MCARTLCSRVCVEKLHKICTEMSDFTGKNTVSASCTHVYLRVVYVFVRGARPPMQMSTLGYLFCVSIGDCDAHMWMYTTTYKYVYDAM